MRIYAGVIIAIAFLAWVVYRLYKRDLRQNMQGFWVYLSFVAVWGFIYGLMLLN